MSIEYKQSLYRGILPFTANISLTQPSQSAKKKYQAGFEMPEIFYFKIGHTVVSHDFYALLVRFFLRKIKISANPDQQQQL